MVHDLKGQKFDSTTVEVSQSVVNSQPVSRITSRNDGALLAEIEGPLFAASGYFRPSIIWVNDPLPRKSRGAGVDTFRKVR